jgi:predicted dehydrogenase
MTDTDKANDVPAAKTAIRGAVIGYGGAFNMGKGHLDWMAKAGIEPVAACDVNAARVAAAKADFPDIAGYTAVEDLLKDPTVDLITVITPHNTHADIAVQALSAGKSVVTEKPMCITSAEATRMIDAAKANGVTLSVFHNRRYDGDFLALKEAVVEKKLIGDVFSIQAGFAGYRHPGQWWRSNKAISGGALYDWGAHFLDWILHLLPGQRVEGVTGFSHKLVWKDVTNEDHVQAILRFESGATADLSMSSISALPKNRWRIQGTTGGILDDGTVKDGMKLFRYVDGMMLEGALKNKTTEWDRYYKDLHAYLTGAAPVNVTAESARRVIAILEAADKSARSGKTEPVAFES